MWYRRRTLVEGVFEAVKRRVGEVVQARPRHARQIEPLCRVVVWNARGCCTTNREGGTRDRGQTEFSVPFVEIETLRSPLYHHITLQKW